MPTLKQLFCIFFAHFLFIRYFVFKNLPMKNYEKFFKFFYFILKHPVHTIYVLLLLFMLFDNWIFTCYDLRRFAISAIELKEKSQRNTVITLSYEENCRKKTHSHGKNLSFICPFMFVCTYQPIVTLRFRFNSSIDSHSRGNKI